MAKKTPELQQGKHWYVIQTQSQREDSVVKRLQENIARENLQAYFGRIIVPTEEVVEIRGGEKVQTERKIFPGYVWVEMEMTPETWHFVKQITGVTRFIGGQSPTPIPQAEVDGVLNQASGKADKPKHKVVFQAGEVVRITEGPFAEFEGVVEDVNYEKTRLRVSVSIFGRATPVELEFSQVSKT
jgi:transcriptional antiterminator NusG